jgi:hypothetical protein
MTYLPQFAKTVVLKDQGPGLPPVPVGKGAAFTFRAPTECYACGEWVKDLVIDDDDKTAQSRKTNPQGLNLKDQANYTVKGCCLSSKSVNVFFKGNDDPKKPDTNYYVLVARARKGQDGRGQPVFQPDEIWISKSEFSDLRTGYVRQRMEAICDALLPKPDVCP